MYYEIFMKNINDILSLRGITKSELAESADMSVSFLSELSNGKANPSLRIMEKIAESLQIPLPALLTDPLPLQGPIPADHVLKTVVLTQYEAFQVDQWVKKKS